MYYITPVFRYSAPERAVPGHYQFGEVFRAAEPSTDAEVIALAQVCSGALGSETEPRINSVGTRLQGLPTTRREGISQDRLGYVRDLPGRTVLPRILDCKVEGARRSWQKPPKSCVSL